MTIKNLCISPSICTCLTPSFHSSQHSIAGLFSYVLIINPDYRQQRDTQLISANHWCVQGGVVAGQGSVHSSMTASMVYKETSCALRSFRSCCPSYSAAQTPVPTRLKCSCLHNSITPWDGEREQESRRKAVTSDTGCQTQAMGYAGGLSAAQVTQLRSPGRSPPAASRPAEERRERGAEAPGARTGPRDLGAESRKRDGQGSTAAPGWGTGARQAVPCPGSVPEGRGAGPGRVGGRAALTGWLPCLPRRSLPQPCAPTVAAGSPERAPPRRACAGPPGTRPRPAALRPHSPGWARYSRAASPSLTHPNRLRLRPSAPHGSRRRPRTPLLSP